MKLNFINNYLSIQFKTLGICIANYPSYFITIPIFVSVILATGLQKWHENNNVKYLLAPENTRHIKEEAVIGKLFPMNLSFNARMERMNREPCLAVVLITAKDKGSILRQHIFQEIFLLDKIIWNITTTGIKNMKYEDLCARNNKKCFVNSILSLKEKIENTNKGNYSIKYPLGREGKYDIHFNSVYLGGVELDNNNNVMSAKALRLFYYLNDDSIYRKRNAEKWLTRFLDTMESTTTQFITIDRYTSISIDKEFSTVVHRIFPRIPLAIIAILIFSILTCLYNSWIESKPWTGAIALTSGGLALVSSFGLIMYFDVPFIASVGSIPFLILGIGMDDAFVFLAAWKRTDSKKSIPERLGQVYSESAISVTITSITNFTAFLSGLFTPYQMVRYFCLFASLDEPKEKQVWFRRIFCTNQAWKSKNNKLNSVSTIWDGLGNILTPWSSKVIVLLIFSFHTAVGFWGITHVDVVGNASQSTASDSYLLQYFRKTFTHFSNYKNRFQIVINQEINYADEKIQIQIEKILSDLKANDLIEDSLTESWLRSYVTFLNNEKMSYFLKDYDTSKKSDFIKVLRQFFLRHPAAQRFRNDIAFNSNYSAIIGSRFLCQTKVTENEEIDIITLQKTRTIVEKAPFEAFPYIFYNYFADDVDLHHLATLCVDKWCDHSLKPCFID
ncbi:patched domain-containing protein 3-like [Centruroides sculpturatus]|uniref:patched domain-containing protein 3-like n=1 Tax=Centruroides sculpturatus TaxID=218467 RepID=UPI000C6E1F07|nr:patched domain-containing protein 3-like [Centruroides sculpturatus]